MSAAIFLPDTQPRHQVLTTVALQTFSGRILFLAHLLTVIFLAIGILSLMLIMTLVLGTDFRNHMLSTFGLGHGWDEGLSLLIALALIATTSTAMLIRNKLNQYQFLIQDLLENEAVRIINHYRIDSRSQTQIERALRGDEFAHDPSSQLIRIHDIERHYIPATISL